MHLKYIFKPHTRHRDGIQDTRMTRPLCTEQEITALVHGFYDRIRQDEQLGPVFNTHIHDWDGHLATMVDFWSSLLLGTGRFSGRPMPRHAALPGLTAPMFHHWLALFDATTDELGNEEMAERAREFARRIARQLWMGYQISNFPDQPMSDLRDHAGFTAQ